MSLSALGVSLELSQRKLLHNVSLEIEPGKVTAVLGPNGAGKTSLLRVLVGEMAADTGEVVLAGRPLGDWPGDTRARMLAVLPQMSLLNFPFTAEEVVMLGRTPHDTGIARDREIVDQALAAVDSVQLAQRFYTHLSGGEKQRVQLARVLAQVWREPGEGERYLVLDEPTSSLDLAHQHMMLTVMRSLAREQVGVLVVLHDLNLAARCADQLVLLRDGVIVVSGSPADVLHADNIRSVFDVEASIGQHPRDGTPLVIT